MAGRFLKAAAISTENVIDMMRLTKNQIRVSMFAAGIGTLKEMDTARLSGK
jgi:isopentenyl diphosphate isomerase/L-lactate dehydrogenase-like FMN-dependent dehydrogenase